jgi:hypothetical protein
MKNYVVLLLILALAGCATVFRGTQQEVTVRTDPDSARIFVDGRLVGSGVASFNVKKTNGNNLPTIRVEEEGYRPQSFQLQNSFDNIALINLTFVYSWTTDFLTGAMFEYAPNSYMIQLIKDQEVGFTEQQRMQQFVLSNAENIKRDIARGGGEYTVALQTYKSDFDVKTLSNDVVKDLLAAIEPWDFYTSLLAL